MVNQAAVGQRIRRMRHISNLDQTEFARKIGIATGSVSKLENGRMLISNSMLADIGEVLDCTIEFLSAELELAPTSRPWLRAYADAPKRNVDQQIDDCTTAMEAAELLDLRSIPDSLPRFTGDLSDHYAIEEFALTVREAAQLSPGDVVGNTIRAAERLGIVVLPMPDEMGRHLGMSLYANLKPIICVSRESHIPGHGVPGDRQRFTVAHEIGHLALHAESGPPETAEEASRIERQAHLFAAAFLAPGDAMQEEYASMGGRVTLQTLANIKENWGISIKALVHRFHSLDLIDADHARSLYKQISSRGWNKSEPVPVGNEQAIWFTKAIAAATKGSSDPLGTAAARAGVGVNHIRRWTDWTPTTEARLADVLTPSFASKSRTASPPGDGGSVSTIDRRIRL